MSFFDILEGRMQQLFEGNQMLAPLPFKKLAKTAVREMKRNAAKIDGRKLAPTLYTILVNEADDQALAPLYQEVTNELVDFLAHEAQADGLELTAAPIVRFIAEPSIKPGKLDVIAEVVSPDVLEEIREEETDYAEHRMIGAGTRPVSGSSAARAAAAPEPVPAMSRVPAQGAASPKPAVLKPIAPGSSRASGGRTGRNTVPVQAPAPAAQPIAAPIPSPAQLAGASLACELIDIKSGRTWRVSVDNTVIGREEATADLVLADTNVSRRHAELSRVDDGWVIADLGSTNGTRVNGQRVTSQMLQSGDVITLGLIELQFKEL